MSTYVFCRHWVKDENTLSEYSDGLDRISRASELSKSKGYDLTFGMITTIGNPELRETVYKIVKRHPKIGIYNLDSTPRGPGITFKQALFDPSRIGITPIVALMDLDQYRIDTEDGLVAATELMQKTERDKALFAVGSRDCPVRLAQHDRNNTLRIIHELFHSCTIGPEKLRAGRRDGVTPAYQETGESTSGFYVANLSHPSYIELLQSVSRASQLAGLSGHSADYYTAIKASRLGRIATGYVQTMENKFYGTRSESEEQGSVRELITKSTEELGKTDVGELLRAAVEADGNLLLISGFYPREDVEFVRQLMLQELTSNNLH